MVGFSRSMKFAAAMVILAAICAHAYVRSSRGPNTPYFVGDPGHVKYFVNFQTQAGLTNLDGNVVITSDSSPTAAILAAFERWSSISGSSLHFDAPITTQTASGITDGQSVITFADTPSNRSITGGAIAVTRLISDSTGKFTDTDIIFNPQFKFSTTSQSDSFDIEEILLHELGHAIGMGHSPSVSATMFAYSALGGIANRALSDDDAAFPRGVYPAAGPSVYGALAIEANVFSGPAADGVLVTAIDRRQNILLTGLSDSSGRVEIRGVPPGNYSLYAEPADGPTFPFNFGQFGVMDSFQTTILGGPDFPVSLSVTSGAETAANLPFQLGLSPLNIVGAGGALAGDPIASDLGLVARRGGHYVFEIYGEGLDAVPFSGISFLGTGVFISGPFERDEVELFGGQLLPLVRFRVNVSPTAPLGSLPLMVRLGDQVSIFTGALEIAASTPKPAFTSNGVVNAASFEAVPLSPGGIFSIFGADLAPAEGFGFFDPLSGGLIETLRGVTVLVDDRPAPLFYVSPGQINAQAPANLEPDSFVTVRVLRDGETSDTRLLPVAAASPGVFVHAESSRAVALNQDGSLNSPENPADRDTVVTLYLTGAGATNPAVATGQPAPLPPPLRRVVGDTAATIGGEQASVEFAGSAPGFVGLVQANVRVPTTAPMGDAIGLRISIGSAASQSAATISIR